MVVDNYGMQIERNYENKTDSPTFIVSQLNFITNGK